MEGLLVLPTEKGNVPSINNMTTPGGRCVSGVLAANHTMAEGMKRPGLLVLNTLPKTANDFRMFTISHPDVIKQIDEFLVKEKDTVQKLKAMHKIIE